MRGRDTWVLLATIVGSSLAFIDATVVALALPEIQQTFHASAGDVAWIVELYTLVLGSLMLLGGALADRYGRKRAFVGGVALFALGSIGCAFSWSIASMLVARVAQAIGGMLYAPASLAILGNHFSGDARARAIASWSAFSSLTSTLGPVMGGVLIDTLGWRSVFWINVPLCAIVIAAALRHVSESRDERAPRNLDWFGALLATLGLGGMTYALILASSAGWNDGGVRGAAIGGVVSFAAFVVYERRTRNPLLPPGLFASKTFSLVNLSTLLLYGATGTLFYELPFAMIQAHGYNALQTAFAMLPVPIGVITLSRFAPRLVKRAGVSNVLTAGPLVVALGFALLALLEPQHSYWIAFFPGVLAIGIGMGITVAPLTNTAIGAAGPQHVGIASGVNTAVARIAALLAIAALTVLLAAIYDRAMPATPVVLAQRDRLGGARFDDPVLQQESQRAFEEGFRGVAAACALLALLAACARPPSPEPEPRPRDRSSSELSA